MAGLNALRSFLISFILLFIKDGGVMAKGGARPGAGRKPGSKSTSQPRKMRGIKVTDKEWKKIGELAFKAGYIKPSGEPNASEYIRKRALREI
ncbi:hypothetical protein Dred_1230 [Desulforamulus reducens MI-1]|uniref:Uncharacterized protein n=1 Tax=Desulforamulus reducens (strain ATCC BAA-1160 / DSM 100696 / MI-1) TaxID=349161 RepID=A4J3W1_DESRM|nr:hypothetical protein [Desulforamulus reducens]ABO49764.1 hypothetical protein Dred_1230 [Desulforamulus reducens MI-1]